MTPTEAIKAVEALQAVADVRLASLQPNDVIVVEVAGELDDHARHDLDETLMRIFRGHDVVVLDNGTTLKVARAAAPPAGTPEVRP